MSRFNFDNGFQGLYQHANKLCNTLDAATLAVHKSTGGCDHDVNVALGKLSEAFVHISEARKLLRQADVLDAHKKSVETIKEMDKS